MGTKFDSPRERAINALKESVEQDVWTSNHNFVTSLRCQIKQHPLITNPIIDVLNKGSFHFEAIKKIHLEYRHAIVQIFTDALLMAQFQTRQLEPRLSPSSKIPARFLFTLNVLDEFGFQPGHDCDEYYQGNPAFAHYPLFEDVLNDLGVSQQERQNYVPSHYSAVVRDFLENSYGSYIGVVALLAVAESQVIVYSPPLREATKAVGINVEHGYYHVHGVTSDCATDAADDDHENDLWQALTQACIPEDYELLNKLCLEYCDLWNEFWNHQFSLSCSHMKSDIVISS